jgi:hypothetical protein
VMAFGATSKIVHSPYINFANAALIGIEFFIAVGLIFVPRPTSYLAFGVFSSFLAILAALFLSGKSTCNCLGSNGTSIHFTILLDAISLNSLVLYGWLQWPAKCLRAAGVFLTSIVAMAYLASSAITYLVLRAPNGAFSVEGAGPHHVASCNDYVHRIGIRNNSGRVVEIGKVLPSCKCTSAEIKPFRLAPNEMRELVFRFIRNWRARS